MTRAVCLGDLMIDVLARLPGPLQLGSDTAAPISLLGGGSAANAAAWLAAAGVETSFVGRVGDDEVGRRAVAELRAAGVNPIVSLDAHRPTGMCIVLVDAEGERTMIPAAGANAGLGEAEVPAALFTPGTHLHLSGYALFSDGARPAASAALALARARGCTVSVDAASSAPLRGVGAETFLSWLPAPTLLIANYDEASVLAQTVDPVACAQWLARRLGEVIVKRGAGGSTWSDGDRVVSVVAEDVVPLDTTGAGDAYAAGVIAERLRGGDITAALRAGTRLAARAVAQLGGRPRPHG